MVLLAVYATGLSRCVPDGKRRGTWGSSRAWGYPWGGDGIRGWLRLSSCRVGACWRRGGTSTSTVRWFQPFRGWSACSLRRTCPCVPGRRRQRLRRGTFGASSPPGSALAARWLRFWRGRGRGRLGRLAWGGAACRSLVVLSLPQFSCHPGVAQRHSWSLLASSPESGSGSGVSESSAIGVVSIGRFT